MTDRQTEESKTMKVAQKLCNILLIRYTSYDANPTLGTMLFNRVSQTCRQLSCIFP